MAAGNRAANGRHREQPLRHRGVHCQRLVWPRLEGHRPARQEAGLSENPACQPRLHALHHDGRAGQGAGYYATHPSHHPASQSAGERDRGDAAARAQTVRGILRRHRARALLRMRPVRGRRPLWVHLDATTGAVARAGGGAHLPAADGGAAVPARTQPLPPRPQDGEHAGVARGWALYPQGGRLRPHGVCAITAQRDGGRPDQHPRAVQLRQCHLPRRGGARRAHR
mmetsp:Transcript_7350/g.18213  ORF Transcript_7350/g.18213 Transcript_7350/m.18213 type:complete len:226 (+) Transcript_7350:922-1599(+)